MATLQDFLDVHNGDEDAVFVTLQANIDKRGTYEESKIARGGVDSSVWDWYDQRLASGGGDPNTIINEINETAQSGLQSTSQTSTTDTRTITAEEYQLQPGETIEQYNARIAALRASPEIVDRGTGESFTSTTGTSLPAENTSPTTSPSSQEVINPQQPNIQASVQPPTVNLQPGATGQEVQQLQNWLVSQGYMTPEQVATGPGIYGPQTTAALARWQTDHNVDNSTGVGYYGPRTMAAIKQTTTSSITPAKSVSDIQGQIQGVQGQLDVFKQAEQAGLQITPQTSLQQAQEFLASPVGSYLSGMGIQANENWTSAFNTQPTASAQDLYEQIYENSGLSELKGQINAYNTKIQAYDDELFDKKQEVNDNPWLTEGVRVREIQKLEDKYENKKANYVAALNRAQGLYDSGREDARWAISQTLAQYNADRNFQQGQLEFAIQRAENAREAAADARQQEFDNAIDLEQLALDQYKATQETNGLSPSQINSTVNSIAGAFDSEPIVKEFNTIQGYVRLFDSLGTSAPDDQARIYAFAKVMDPNSVVRESEYKTVQEYSQALLKAAGINLARVFTSTGALSAEARSAMSTTLNTKLSVQSGLYNQVSQEYQRQIQDAYAGLPRTITNYQPPTPPQPTETPENIFNSVIAPTTQTSTPTTSGGIFSSFLSGLFSR